MSATFRLVVIASALLVTVGPASAQERPTVSLSSSDPSRWDVAGHLGWFGSRSGVVTSPGIPYSYDSDWWDAASFAVSGGYYWTPQVKLELDVATTRDGRTSSYESFTFPGEIYPYYRSRRYRIRNTSLSGGVTYQFFENRWFHPFVGAGFDFVRRRLDADPTAQGPSPRTPTTPAIPGLPGSTTVTYLGRPFVGGGFKVYGSERVFLRTDLRFTLASEGARSVVWRGGVGFDF
jgi:hypothetical protein